MVAGGRLLVLGLGRGDGELKVVVSGREGVHCVRTGVVRVRRRKKIWLMRVG